MNMKKWLCMALAVLMTLGAVALAEGDGDLQAQLDAANARVAELEAQVEFYRPYYESQVVAEYGEGGVIMKEDAQQEFDYYSSMYAQYGMSIDAYAAQIKQDILESMVREAVLHAKAAELGLDQLDDEARANLEAEVDENFETYITTYKDYFAQEGASDEEAREQTIAALEQYGMTRESLMDQMLNNHMDEQLHAYVTGDVTVTDEDVQAAYEAKVESDKSSFVDDDGNVDDYTYNSTRTGGTAIAWNPEGYRAVKHVLVKFDDDQASLYKDLQSTLSSLNAELEALDQPAEEAEATEEGAEEAAEEPAETEAPEETAAPRSREEIQADIARVVSENEALYAQLLPTAQQVIDEFNAGADIDALIEKYGGDPGMKTEPAATAGYAVSADSTYWESAFTEGAMGIEAVGQISEPVYGSNGIHIIYYLADITPGAVPFEEIEDAVREEALSDKISSVYDSQVEAWVEEAAPVYHADRF